MRLAILALGSCAAAHFLNEPPRHRHHRRLLSSPVDTLSNDATSSPVLEPRKVTVQKKVAVPVCNSKYINQIIKQRARPKTFCSNYKPKRGVTKSPIKDIPSAQQVVKVCSCYLKREAAKATNSRIAEAAKRKSTTKKTTKRTTTKKTTARRTTAKTTPRRTTTVKTTSSKSTTTSPIVDLESLSRRTTTRRTTTPRTSAASSTSTAEDEDASSTSTSDGTSTSESPVATVFPRSTYISRAETAIKTMQTFYNGARAGQWSTSWWSCAQAYILLVDARKIDSSSMLKKITDGANGVIRYSIDTQVRSVYGGVQWTRWYDDELWWALGLIAAYDLTGNATMLDLARRTWKSVNENAMNAPCGGLYCAQEGEVGRAQSVITTLLYVETCALFAARYPRDRQTFTNKAMAQWKWVMSNVFIRNKILGDVIRTKPNNQTQQCWNNGAELTYLDGKGIDAAIALNQLTGDYSYLEIASTIASTVLVDPQQVKNGTMHDNCDNQFNCNVDEAQFKGILARSLRNLYDVMPDAAGGQIPAFLKFNSDQIWTKARSTDGKNLIGQNWAGPYFMKTPLRNSYEPVVSFAQHSSATMALVAAAQL